MIAINRKIKLLGFILICMIIGLFGFYCGLISKLGKQQIELQTLNNNIIEVEDKLEKNNTELQLCYGDMASVETYSTGTYEFSTFGIYHPLLDGQKVETTTYQYKNNQVTLNSATFKGSDSNPAFINVWILKKGQFPQYLDRYVDFPTFGGYENHGTPVFISDIMKTWNERDVYKSKNGSFYHYSYHATPKEVGLVSLDYYSNFSPAGGPIFVEVFQNIEQLSLEQYQASKDLSVSYVNNPRVKTAKQKLQIIVDQLDVKL